MKDFKGYLRNGHDHWLRDLLLVALVLGIPLFQYLGALPLMDPDEGRYAEIPREMLERGDLITPTLNYVKYFEKPPLLYWLNAASLKLFGLGEFAARFPSALCGLATIMATYVLARRLYDRRTALLAAVILGSSIGFVVQSRIILTDMLLTLCLTGALGSYIVAANDHRRRGSGFAWHLFYFFCGLAVLTKGLIGIVFPAGIIFFHLLFTGSWRLVYRSRAAGGTLLFLLVTVPWFLAVSLRNPEFARFFFIHEHFERFTSTVHGRYQPFWFFVPVLAVTMLPWSFFIPGALLRAWRDRHHDEGRNGFYLLIWILVIFLFFSKSSSKLIPYVLPIFPPLAILIAHQFSLVSDGRAREIKGATWLLGLGLCLVAAVAGAYAFLPDISRQLLLAWPQYAKQLTAFQGHAPAIGSTACIALAVLAALQGITCLLLAGTSPLRLILVLAGGALAMTILICRLVMPAVTAGESTRELAGAVARVATAETRIVTWGPMQSLNWYTRRRTATYYLYDELEFGSRQGDQAAWFLDTARLQAAWKSEQHLLLVATRDTYESLQVLNPLPGPRIVGSAGKYLIVSNK